VLAVQLKLAVFAEAEQRNAPPCAAAFDAIHESLIFLLVLHCFLAAVQD
jgi:hypothetical protein